MEILHLDAVKLTFVGCKGWRGTLNNGRHVFAKLWDAWKLSESDSEHEACVYYRLRDLWTTVVPLALVSEASIIFSCYQTSMYPSLIYSPLYLAN